MEKVTITLTTSNWNEGNAHTSAVMVGSYEDKSPKTIQEIKDYTARIRSIAIHYQVAINYDMDRLDDHHTRVLWKEKYIPLGEFLANQKKRMDIWKSLKNS